MLDDVSSVAVDWVSAPLASWEAEEEMRSLAEATVRDEDTMAEMVERRLVAMVRMAASSCPGSSSAPSGISMVRSWAARALAQLTARVSGTVMLRTMNSTRPAASTKNTSTTAMLRPFCHWKRAMRLLRLLGDPLVPGLLGLDQGGEGHARLIEHPPRPLRANAARRGARACPHQIEQLAGAHAERLEGRIEHLGQARSRSRRPRRPGGRRSAGCAPARRGRPPAPRPRSGSSARSRAGVSEAASVAICSIVRAAAGRLCMVASTT